MAGFQNLGERGICKICGEKARKGSAYYCVEHTPIKPTKVISPEDKARKADIPEVVEIVASKTPTRATTNAPSMKEWSGLLGELMAYISVVIAAKAVSHKAIDAQSTIEAEEQASQIALSDDEADKIVKPISRIIARSAVNKRYGRQIMDNSDLLQAVFVMKDFYDRVQPFLAEKREIKKLQKMAERPSPTIQEVQPNGNQSWQYTTFEAGPNYRGFGLPNS